ncbi:MAG: hypothetical protein FWC23_09285, partial [Chitinispirillia bacterium]|nr:hypothetical protein [Chitinispirillia bacterium]MCL2269362.1 hypothetical protein [Chitinispirillia bacterium]
MGDNPDDDGPNGPDANREFKDGMFRAIFKEPAEFRRVASYLLKTDFGPDTPMEEVTLSSPLYMGPKNDVSFLVDGRLIVFTEHQSTVSPNIPLRFLIYVADTYKARFSRGYERILAARGQGGGLGRGLGKRQGRRPGGRHGRGYGPNHRPDRKRRTARRGQKAPR